MDSRDKGSEGVDRIQPAQDGDQRWAIMNTVMNLRLLQQQRISWKDDRLSSFQGNLCTLELVSKLTMYIVWRKTEVHRPTLLRR